jgi:hypothetical protein
VHRIRENKTCLQRALCCQALGGPHVQTPSVCLDTHEACLHAVIIAPGRISVALLQIRSKPFSVLIKLKGQVFDSSFQGHLREHMLSLD